MKRFFLIAVLSICFAMSANGQIKMGQTFTNDLIIIGNISEGKAMNVVGALSGAYVHLAEHKLYCRIYMDKKTYGILVDTENRFDDDLEFALGTDMEKAKESLEMLLSFMENSPLKTSQTVTDEDDRVIQLNLIKRNYITLQAIDAHGKIICDKVVLTKNNLERALKLLDKKAERKVMEAFSRNNGGL